MRPTLNPQSSIILAKPTEGSSPIRPADRVSRPIFMAPLKNVPVVIITLLASIALPSPT